MTVTIDSALSALVHFVTSNLGRHCKHYNICFIPGTANGVMSLSIVL
uniref:Uncharacterized protein n=1 Tax=Heterorhabditis bacteriophora TaxID=37862 RepID=A0A1I7WCS1_HETBA